MSVAEPIVGRVRVPRKLVGEDLADWLDVDPEELNADEVFAEAYEPKGIEE